MNNFSKRLTVFVLGTSMVVGVGTTLLFASKNITKVDATPEIGTTYTLVNSESELVEGANYTILGGSMGSYDALSTYVQQDYIRGIRIVTQGDFPSTFVSKKTTDEEVLNLKLVKYTENQQVKWALKTTNYYGTNGYLGGGSNQLLVCDTPRSVTFSIDSSAIKRWATIYLEGSDLKLNFIGTTPGQFRCSSNNGISLYKAVTTAKDWADDFLATTETPCAESTQDHQAALEEVWNSTVTKYNLLSADDKELLKSATYEDVNLGAAVERYDIIIKKYDSSSETISNYIDRSITSSNMSIIKTNAPTIIITVVALAGVSAITVCLLIKKYKHKKQTLK